MDTIVSELQKWLGPDGIEFFRLLHDKFGTVSPVCYLGPNDEPLTYKEAYVVRLTHYGPEKAPPPLPHPVHFREGMSVRNFLRTLSECKDWTPNDFDSRWADLVERAIDAGPGECDVGGDPSH